MEQLISEEVRLSLLECESIFHDISKTKPNEASINITHADKWYARLCLFS